MKKEEAVKFIKSSYHQEESSQEDLDKIKDLIQHPVKQVRVDAIKRLAKEKDTSYLPLFQSILDDSSKDQVMRREAMSALGRMRDTAVAQEIAEKYLIDSNPEIALQAIRGLLVFKKEQWAIDALIPLKNHKNEVIQRLIQVEFPDESGIDTDTKKTHALVNPLFENKVIHGDSLEVLKQTPDRTFHLTFTSPPYYNARDYSIYSSYEEYLDFLDELFTEVHRTTKDGRFLIVNTSPVIIPRAGRKYSSIRYPIPYDVHARLMNQGWDFIDDIIWLKPEASVKNRVGGFHQRRTPLGYKPNAVTESLMVYRKKTDKLIDWNIAAYDKEVVLDSKVNGDYDSSNVWEINPVYDKNHSAVFPIELCNRVVKYYSMKGDLVFDPFAGSGTLGKSALNLGRKIFMSEIDDDYFDEIQNSMGLLQSQVDFIEYENFLTNTDHDE